MQSDTTHIYGQPEQKMYSAATSYSFKICELNYICMWGERETERRVKFRWPQQFQQSIPLSQSIYGHRDCKTVTCDCLSHYMYITVCGVCTSQYAEYTSVLSPSYGGFETPDHSKIQE
jgi:hypothetical protein